MGGKVDYYQYIQSPEWRQRASAAKQRAGYRCQVCNRSSNQVTLDAHHRTYERLGNERPEDITVLCRDCHELFEVSRKLSKPPRPIAPTQLVTVTPRVSPPPFTPKIAPTTVAPRSQRKANTTAFTAWVVTPLVLIGIFVSSRLWVPGADEDPTPIATVIATQLPTATLPKATPTATQPQSTPTLAAAFSSLSFCHEDEFDLQSEKCRRNQDVFSGVVERLYVSWIPSKQYNSASFLKKWYIDGLHFLDSESSNEFGYLEVDTRPSLKPGTYVVELYVTGKLVQRGSFVIANLTELPPHTPVPSSRTSSPIKMTVLPPHTSVPPTLIPAPPTLTPTSTPSCDPNYAGACISIVSYDLNCGDVSARRFQSIGRDPHGFDGDGDGVACESD